jgi:hypothetical protein
MHDYGCEAIQFQPAHHYLDLAIGLYGRGGFATARRRAWAEGVEATMRYEIL